MFNAPRRMGGPLSSSAFLSSNPSTAVDPLAQSTPNPSGGFGEVDPWSAVPSPARSGTPRRDSDEAVTSTSPAGLNGDATGNVGLNGLINDPPALYLSLLDSLDPSPSATVPLSAVHRLLSSSGLPASTLERIVHLTARDSSFLSRSEFFAALGLVALAQSNGLAADEISIESLSSQAANLPLPKVSFAEPQLTPAAPETPGLTSPWDTRPSALPEYTSAVESSRDQTEPESGYWKTLERVDVALISEKEGWFLQKYKIESDKRGAGPLSRRYSDFVWLLDCLVKRYPFRLLPSLPPKRIGPDASFLEQRRKGLKRFLNMLVNHPVTRDDGALNVFLTEPNFESWRKRVKVSTEEESTSKKLTQAQEMAIPTDLSQRLTLLREYLPKLLNSYQKLVVLAERSLARLQSEAGDESRIAMALGTISEEMPKCCYRGTPEAGGCSACAGVSRGLSDIGDSWAKAAEENEKRAQSVLLGSIEALKTQRDLYVAFRDLFVRHDKLSKDSVDALLKKVETRQKKVESLKSAQKPGWDVEVDKLVSANDQDTSTISNLRSRRVFIRACMWHELSVVFHSRQNAQVTLGWREFVKDQSEANKAMGRVWEDLTERMTRMPLD